MADNLLRNPGFELDWGTEKRNTAYVFPFVGDPYEVKFGNLFIPPGYDGFYRHGRPADFHDPKNPDGWVQPEVTHMAKAQYPERVAQGQQAVKVCKGHGIFDGGLMQQVDVEPHRRYRLFAEAHAWSHNRKPMDAYWSEGPGRGAGYLLEGDPPPASPGTLDDWRNFTFYLGIDPTGGSNPYATSVVWGRGAHIYNVFAPVPMVETIAQAERITIFLRSKCLWPFINNDAYWDAAQLQLADQPQPGKCRGHPRTQYPRKFNVYPEGATKARKLEIAGIAIDRGNETWGGSYDDACIGDLDSRTAVLWDIPAVERPKYESFVAEHYPGVVVKFDGTGAPDPLDKWKPFALCQRNPIWANIVRAGTSCKAPANTIGADGCWDTSCAMAQNILGVRKAATPVTVNNELGPWGFDASCQVKWAPMKTALNLEVTSKVTSAQTAIDWLKAGNVCFADVVVGTSKHFWLLCEWVQEKTSYIGIDPLDGQVKWLAPAKVEDYRLVRVYNPPPQPTTSVNNIGAHYQALRDWLPYTRPKANGGADPDYHKLVGGFEECWNIWRENPRVEVGLRYYTDAYDKYFHAATPEAGAKLYWGNHGDAVIAIAKRVAVEMPGKVIWVEGFNEVIGTFTWEIDKWVQLEVAMWNLINSLNLPIGFIPGCIAVGNPHETEFIKLLPLAKIASANPNRCRLGYHAYWYANQQESGLVPHWKWLAGRWQEMAKFFAANGAPGVRWLCGEGGAVGGRFIPDSKAFLKEAGLATTATVSALSTNGGVERTRDDGKQMRYIPRWKADASRGALMALAAEPATAAAEALSGGYVLLPIDGWKSKECYNGNLDRYTADIKTFHTMLGDTADCTLFTVTPWGWESFRLGSPEWARIQAALK